MNIVASITAHSTGSKRRRDSRQTTTLGGEFGLEVQGQATSSPLQANDDFAAGFIRLCQPMRLLDVLEAQDFGRLGFV
jgi:hypothetical protein